MKHSLKNVLAFSICFNFFFMLRWWDQYKRPRWDYVLGIRTMNKSRSAKENLENHWWEDCLGKIRTRWNCKIVPLSSNIMRESHIVILYNKNGINNGSKWKWCCSIHHSHMSWCEKCSIFGIPFIKKKK